MSFFGSLGWSKFALDNCVTDSRGPVNNSETWTNATKSTEREAS
jgi:hypothetical protein